MIIATTPPLRSPEYSSVEAGNQCQHSPREFPNSPGSTYPRRGPPSNRLGRFHVMQKTLKPFARYLLVQIRDSMVAISLRRKPSEPLRQLKHPCIISNIRDLGSSCVSIHRSDLSVLQAERLHVHWGFHIEFILSRACEVMDMKHAFEMIDEESCQLFSSDIALTGSRLKRATSPFENRWTLRGLGSPRNFHIQPLRRSVLCTPLSLSLSLSPCSNDRQMPSFSKCREHYVRYFLYAMVC